MWQDSRPRLPVSPLASGVLPAWEAVETEPVGGPRPFHRKLGQGSLWPHEDITIVVSHPARQLGRPLLLSCLSLATKPHHEDCSG